MVKSTLDLMKITGSVGTNGGHIRIVNCDSIVKIVGTYPSNITLDFTERN